MKFLTTDYSSLATVGSYRIDTGRRLRLEEYRGKTRLSDFKANISSMASDPCWAPEFHGLIDLTDAELDLAANDVLRLALVLKQEPYRSTGWLAFVATDSTTYGMVRMLGYWSRNTERMRIFQNRSEAERWLELNIDQVPPGFIEESGHSSPAILRNAV